MNVFVWPLRKSYYLRRPWKWLRQLRQNVKEAHQRITKGYCDSDVFNMDSWMLKVMPAMLKEMADVGLSFPGFEPFETPEKWSAWLVGMAERMEQLQQPWSETRNEFEEPYFERSAARSAASQKPASGCVTPTAKEVAELREKWLARMKELEKEEKQFTLDLFIELATYLRLLWI